MTGLELLKWLQKVPEENLKNEILISVDVSTCDEDYDHRIFAMLGEVIYNDPSQIPFICEKTYDNYER